MKISILILLPSSGQQDMKPSPRLTAARRWKYPGQDEPVSKRGQVAAKRAWATVNKTSGGGQKGGKAAASRSALS